MRCGQGHGGPVRRARPPPAECEYDEVWTCERGISALPVTTGHPPHVFQMRINQQEGVLVVVSGAADAADVAPRLGARACLNKPFELSELLHNVEEVAPRNY